jgi:hypothetical protein
MTPRCPTSSWFAIAITIALLPACKQSSSDSAAKVSAEPSGVPSVASAASSAAAQGPWYAGKWSGTYKAELSTIVMQRSEGMVPAWAADDGKNAAGMGKLDLEIDPSGLTRGRSEGPLGVLEATGTVDHDTLRVSLVPEAVEPGKAFHGFLVASRSGDAITGNLQASSGDSLVVRKATVSLEKR